MATPHYRLKLDLQKPQDLSARLVPNGKSGGIMLDGALPGALGAFAELIVRFSEPVERHFSVQVQLAWARHVGNASLKEGYGVDFVDDDQAARERLLAYARGEVAPERSRFDVRIATDLPVTVRYQGKLRKETMLDLSQGGAFVRSSPPVPIGAIVELHVRPPRSLTPIRLRGRVAWIRESGPAPGFGAEFVYDSARQATRIQGLLQKLEKKQLAQRP